MPGRWLRRPEGEFAFVGAALEADGFAGMVADGHIAFEDYAGFADDGAVDEQAATLAQ